MDFTLFAPLGLAISVGEAIPELARKGRARLEPQIGVARTVGQLAVGQGRRQVLDMLPFKGGLPKLNLPLLGNFPAGGRQRRTAPATTPAATPLRPVVRRPPSTRPAAGHVPAPRPPTTGQSAGGGAAHLAIHSYDALSASQVVQRLAGLSREEVRAVRAYEASTRGRRTILSRADQLLA